MHERIAIADLFDRLAGVLHRLLLGGPQDGGLAILLRQVAGVLADPLGLAVRHALCRAGATGKEAGQGDKQDYFLHGDTHRC